MNININIKPELKPLIRIKILSKVIRELAQGFGVPDFPNLTLLEKGIVTQQLIQTVWIYYLDVHGKAIGEVTMRIDWDQHQLLANSDGGKELKIDSKQSIKDQISNMYQLLIRHTEDLRRAYNVQKVDVYYVLRPEISSDKKKFNEALQFLNLITIDKLPDWAEDLPPDVEMRYASKRLKELGITIEHNKPKV